MNTNNPLTIDNIVYLLNQENINIISKEFDSQINLKIELTNEQFELLKTLLSRNILVL